jgi:hypothetical protein
LVSACAVPALAKSVTAAAPIADARSILMFRIVFMMCSCPRRAWQGVPAYWATIRYSKT